MTDFTSHLTGPLPPAHPQGFAVAKRISASTIRRLSFYLRSLERLRARGATTVSSEQLAEDGGTTGAQVRKDLSQFGSFGKRGTGYDVGALSEHLRGILGLHRRWRVLLVGAGRIGAALFEYPNFSQRGYDCVAIVDNDPDKVGRRWGTIPIQSADRMECIIEAEDIDLVILAVPGEVAQSVAERAVSAGALGLMNFAPTQLRRPATDVPVAEVNLVMELEALSFAIMRGGRPA
ncbi:MAG TPA: redox-sensing transcriptional repressor Rex [Longimicrobiales bacterium]|nr:redox-sensing transcriptional repressor Rex [Longimicrobiales bacterium]